MRRRHSGSFLAAWVVVTVAGGCADVVSPPAPQPWTRHLATLESRDAYHAESAPGAGGESFVASPWIGTLTLGATTLQGDGVGAHQTFVAALDARGEPRWARTLRGAPDVRVAGLVADVRDGGVVAVGGATGGLAVEGRAGALPEGAFVVRYDRAGAVRGALHVAAGERSTVVDAAVDDEGTLYVAVLLSAPTRVAGVPTETTAIAAFERDGRPRWAHSFDGAEAVNGVTVVAGGVVATVTHRRPLSFAGRVVAAPAEPQSDVALVALTRTGAVRWVREIRSTGTEVFVKVAAAPRGELVVGGRWFPVSRGPTRITAGDVTVEALETGSAVFWLRGDGVPLRGRFVPGVALSAFAIDGAGGLWGGAEVQDERAAAQLSRPVAGSTAFVAGLRPEGPLAVRSRFVADGGAYVTSLRAGDGALMVAVSGVGPMRHDDAMVWRPSEFMARVPATSTFVARFAP